MGILNLFKNKHKSTVQKIAEEQEEYIQDFKKIGVDFTKIIPQIGVEISWADIANHLFRIFEFDRNGTTIDKNYQINAKSPIEPYGYLLAESPILNNRVKIPIIHHDDFSLAASVFDEPELEKLINNDELLVTYSPKEMNSQGLSQSLHHVLHYSIAPIGTLNKYYSMKNCWHISNPKPQKLVGSFIYEGEIKVQMIPNPNFE